MAQRTKPINYTLELAFDINQVTRALQYKFTSQSGSPHVKTGPLAGTLCFEKGDNLDFSLTVTGTSTDKIKVKVTNFALVSIGTGLIGKYALSMLDEKKSINDINNWPKPKDVTTSEDTQNNIIRLLSKAEKTYPIVSVNGSWKLSGHLSVEIELNGKTYYRDLNFDPESSGGNGGGLGKGP